MIKNDKLKKIKNFLDANGIIAFIDNSNEDYDSNYYSNCYEKHDEEHYIEEVDIEKLLKKKNLTFSELKQVIFENGLLYQAMISAELIDILKKYHKKLNLKVPKHPADLINQGSQFMYDKVYEFALSYKTKNYLRKVGFGHIAESVEATLQNEFSNREKFGYATPMLNNVKISIKVIGVFTDRVIIRCKILKK